VALGQTGTKRGHDLSVRFKQQVKPLIPLIDGIRDNQVFSVPVVVMGLRVNFATVEALSICPGHSGLCARRCLPALPEYVDPTQARVEHHESNAFRVRIRIVA
jgi:hypothetical protein